MERGACDSGTCIPRRAWKAHGGQNCIRAGISFGMLPESQAGRPVLRRGEQLGVQLMPGFCAGATSRPQPCTRAAGGAWQRWWRGLVCFPSALFKNSSSCGALRNRAEPRPGGQWPPSPWERSCLSSLPPPGASPRLCPPRCHLKCLAPVCPSFPSPLLSLTNTSHPVSAAGKETPAVLGDKGAGGSPVVLTEVAGGAGGDPGWLQPGVTRDWRRLLGAG